VFTLCLVIVGPVGGERGPGISAVRSAGFAGSDEPRRHGIDAIRTTVSGTALIRRQRYASTAFGIRADYRYFRNVTADDSNNIVGISFNQGPSTSRAGRRRDLQVLSDRSGSDLILHVARVDVLTCKIKI